MSVRKKQNLISYLTCLIGEPMSLRPFTLLVNIKKRKSDIYIGRPSKWGNPFKMKYEDERLWVVTAHKDWLDGIKFQGFAQEEREWILANLHLLEGKILGCYCSPKLCHGNNYINLIKKRTASLRHTCGCDRLNATWCRRALSPFSCHCLCHANHWEDKIVK